MLCNKCHKNEATVYYKQNINGEVREYALCAECAAQSDIGFSPLSLFGAFNTAVPLKREQKHCTLCSSTLDEIRRNGKVGCAECYSVFKNELEPMIHSIHHGAVHRGRAPMEYTDNPSTENELDSLRTQLRNAIENEEYERAAELRDMIKEKEADNE